MRTDFHVENSRNHKISYHPCFVLDVDIPWDECTIEDCLDNHFKAEKIEGYQVEGKNVRATQTVQFQKLPNILMITLKRFVYKNGLIKKKEHVYFNDTLTIEDAYVSPQLQLGIFKRASEYGSMRKYRLFSIVEHIG